MNKSEFETYLNQRYQPQVKWYSNRSSANKRKYTIFQWTLIISSSLTPILILMEPYSNIVPTLVSVLVAIMASALKTFKYQENWLSYRTIGESLKKEKHFYNASLYEYQTVSDKEGLFVERVEALISRENTKWIEIHKPEKTTK